ncbi:MAG: CoA transferase [Chloroflexi bacterium]|nr:CoA transferase [Chloroflexota bacterium]
MAGVLDGIKIVAMEQWVVVPNATALLADWGADVIKVEPLSGETFRGTGRIQGRSTWQTLGGMPANPGYEFLNRNKRGLAVDLKKDAGREVLCQLIKKADVFLANYEISALKNLRLDYDTLSQLNSRLIYGLFTGYGSKGPDKDERAYDDVAAWARSGMEHEMSVPGCPPPTQPHGMGDRVASVHVVAGIVAALFSREKTGEGQEVEFSLFHSALWSLSGVLSGALMGPPSSRRVLRTKVENPLTNNYPTKDGRWVRLALPTSDLFWPDLCKALERPDLEKDPRFNGMAPRRENGEELIRILDEVFTSRTIAEWEERLRKYHLIFSRVQTPEEVVKDPQALANDCFTEIPHPGGAIKTLASPVKFRKNPSTVRMPTPQVGQHTEEILLEIGYGWEDIARLKEQKVIL